MSMHIHREIDRILKLMQETYSTTVPKSVDPTNENIDEQREEGRRDAEKVKHRDDYGTPR